MYATLLLPNFRLQAVLRFSPPPWRTEPVALHHSQDGRSTLLEVSEAAPDWFDLHVALSLSDTELTQEEIKLLLEAKGEGRGK